MSPRPAARAAILFTALALALALVGCGGLTGSGRDLGTGFVQGVRHSAITDSMRWAIDSLAMRTGQSVGRALGEAIAPVVDSSLAGLLARSRGSLLETSDSVEARLRGSLGQAASGALESAIERSARRLRLEADPTLAAWTSAANGRLRPVLVGVVGEAADTFSVRVSRHVATDLSVSFESLMVRSVRAADRESSKSKITGELRRTLAIAGGIAVLALGLFAAWLWRDRRKGQQSLAAVARVINRSENEYLKPKIKEEARTEGAESWLNGFLRKNDLL